MLVVPDISRGIREHPELPRMIREDAHHHARGRVAKLLEEEGAVVGENVLVGDGVPVLHGLEAQLLIEISCTFKNCIR